MLTALCGKREVVISRGQLIEIGGGFRIPDIMAQSGAKLVEVGTTNRTHISDYQRAIGDNTAALLAAHHSNFKIIGFTSEPGLAELSQLAHEHQLLMLYDQGSGALIDTAPYGLEHEPTVGEAIDDGVDVVSFSGDKLLGGPQAGILSGSSGLVDQLKRHPLARAVRADKLCLAALTETLIAHLTDRAILELPVWQMIGLELESIFSSATEIVKAIRQSNLGAQVVEGESAVGGGSLPGTTIPTWLVAVTVSDADSFSASLRANDPPIIARIADGRVIFDPRTLLPGQSEQVAEAILKLSGIN
jgi:L-seryl-tRNA(Ser) seleniumtransferase